MTEIKTKDLPIESTIDDAHSIITTKSPGTVRILFSTLKAWIKGWIVKADVGLGSVDNTADSAKNVLSATKLTTARTINGTSFDGTANVVLNERVISVVTGVTPTINVDVTDIYKVTALDVPISGFIITGTPTNGQPLVIMITTDASSRAVDLGSSFVDMVASKTFTVAATKKTTVVAVYNSTSSKFEVMSVLPQL